MERKRVLVTGGAGFIGSHLCDRLLSLGCEVTCVDNFSTGRKENIAHLFSSPYFKVISHDITFPIFVEVDEIYNFACPASPLYYQLDPVQTVKTCVMGSINMLGLAKRLGAKILQASTSEVYGDPEVHPQHEGYSGSVNPIGRRSCYDEGKRCAESLFYDYRRQHSVDVRVARIFNTYGPRMQGSDGRVVSSFISQALKNDPITVFGKGTQTRSFCYIDDLIDGVIWLMRSAYSFPVNLGNPVEVSIIELASKITELINSKSVIIHSKLPEDDPSRRKPDISLASEVIDWEPRISLNEGLALTVEYHQKELSSPKLVSCC